MMTLLYLLLFLACVLLVGRAVASLSRHRTVPVSQEERLAAALGIGVVLLCFVPTMVSGIAGLLSFFEMGRGTVAGVAVLLAAAATALAWRTLGHNYWQELRAVPDWRFPAFLGLVFIVYLLCYDAHLLVPTTCALRAGVVPVRNYLSQDTRMLMVPPYMMERNAFLIWPNGIRLGPTFMIAPFLAWFDQAGLRILHAMCGVLIAAFSYATASRIFARPWAGYVMAIATALNPFMLSIPHVDENVLALAPVAGALYFLFSPAYSSWAAGAMLGFAIGSRHVLVLCVPGLFVPYLLKSQWKKLAWASIGLLVFCIPWIAVHTAHWIQQGGLGYESFAIRPHVDYEILGYRFNIRAFLGWPFADEALRSPYNGFPTVVSYPLTMIRTFGLLFCGAMLAGLFQHGGLSLLKRLTALLWLVPFTAMLMVQAGWEEPNKMGIFLVVSPVLTLLGTAGLVGLVRKGKNSLALGRFTIRWSKRGAIFLSAGVLLCTAFMLATRSKEYKLDDRTFKQRLDRDAQNAPIYPPRLYKSEEVHAVSDRQQFSGFSVLPDLSMAFPLASITLSWYRVAEIFAEFHDPASNHRYTSFKDPENQAMAIGLRPEFLAHLDGATPTEGEDNYRDGMYGKVFATEEFLPSPDDNDQDTMVDQDFLQLFALLKEKGMRALPLTMMLDSPFDEIYGAPDYYSCDSEEPERPLAVALDLTSPPVGNPSFVTVQPPDAGAIPLARGRMVIVRDIPVTWLDDGHAHIMAIWSKEGAVNITIYVGDISFEHIADLCHVDIIDFEDAPFLIFQLPPNEPLYLRQYTSVRPRCYHAWRGITTSDDVRLSRPFRTSY
jgi:hypothetical protein